MLLTLSKRHSSPLPSLYTRFPILNLSWKLMLWTMLSLQSFLLWMKKNKVHSVTFYSYTFTIAELNLWHIWQGITCNFLRLSKFGNTTSRVQPILLMLLWIIKTLSIFLLPKCWPGGKQWSEYLSQFNLLSGFILVISAPNQILSLDNGTSTLKGGILVIPQSTLTTSNQSSLKNNLWLLYKLLFFSFLFFVQLQLLIWILCTKTFFQLFLVT